MSITPQQPKPLFWDENLVLTITRVKIDIGNPVQDISLETLYCINGTELSQHMDQSCKGLENYNMFISYGLAKLAHAIAGSQLEKIAADHIMLITYGGEYRTLCKVKIPHCLDDGTCYKLKY